MKAISNTDNFGQSTSLLVLRKDASTETGSSRVCQTTLAEVKLVKNHHNPKPSVIVQRFKFHSHFRKSGQSVANFVAELRQLSEHCDFGAV